VLRDDHPIEPVEEGPVDEHETLRGDLAGIDFLVGTDSFHVARSKTSSKVEVKRAWNAPAIALS
jgi:hypothetical protein